MLLTALKAYGEANRAPDLPEFYDRQEVRYRIDLDSNGNLLSFVGMNDLDNPKRGVKLPIPYVKRTSAILPLLIDKGDYLLGIPAKKNTGSETQKATARAQLLHKAYLELLEEATAATHSGPLGALLNFARSYVPMEDDPRLPEAFDAASFIAVFVDGHFVAADPIVQKWWAGRQKTPGSGARACAVCGHVTAVIETVPVGIRGFSRVGGTATMALISGNDDVFERHGMPRASGAGICIDCGNTTHQALNQLIADPVHCKQLGTTLIVWWATEDCEDLLAAVLEGYTDGAVGEVLASIMSGRVRAPVNTSRFYGVALGASKARVVVRSWVDTTLGAAQDNIRKWFGRVRVVDRNGSVAPPPGLFRLLASLAPPGQGDALGRIDPKLPTEVLEAALAGKPLPRSVLAQAIGRIRAEQGAVTALRAALLKACLTQPDNPNLEDHMTGLDLENTDPAYLCGRLLALLDEAARLATSANNSLVDRSYAAASTMPAVTFTRLLRLHRAHLDKLKRDNRGAGARIDRTVAEIMSGFGSTTGIPGTLGITEQARFALGLYHQQAAGRAAIEAAAAKRALAAPVPGNDNPTIDQNQE
jgi:CRISPR-associated protein Csd1